MLQCIHPSATPQCHIGYGNFGCICTPTTSAFTSGVPLLLLTKLQLFKRKWKAEITYIKTAIPINNASKRGEYNATIYGPSEIFEAATLAHLRFLSTAKGVFKCTRAYSILGSKASRGERMPSPPPHSTGREGGTKISRRSQSFDCTQLSMPFKTFMSRHVKLSQRTDGRFKRQNPKLERSDGP